MLTAGDNLLDLHRCKPWLRDVHKRNSSVTKSAPNAICFL